MIRSLVAIACVAIGEIGDNLRSGVTLQYESGGAAQAPWTYDSVRVVVHDDYDRCVMVGRRDQPARTSCARGDTLFDRTPDGFYRPARPIGEDMVLRVPGGRGTTLTFTTGAIATQQIEGLVLRYLSTTITTRDSTGAITRRLTERYAPSLLTALSGIFEVPDDAGGWRVANRFTLVEIRD